MRRESMSPQLPAVPPPPEGPRRRGLALRLVGAMTVVGLLLGGAGGVALNHVRTTSEHLAAVARGAFDESLETLRGSDAEPRIRSLSQGLDLETQSASRVMTRALLVSASILGLALLACAAVAGLTLRWLVQAYRREELALQMTRTALASRREILGIVAHDLRSPLTVLGLKAQQIRRSTQEETTRAHAVSVGVVTSRMERLIQNLLDDASLEAGSLSVHDSVCSVAGLVREATELARTVGSSRGVGVTSVSSLPEASTLQVDRDRILQLLGNLFGNAIQFSRRGGAVRLEVERSGDDVRFSVSDSGAGIAPEHLPHVFARYWTHTGGSSRGGTGLGLSIARSIVEAHGGHIWVDSAVGQGTTVSFTLPAEGGPAELLPLPSAELPAEAPQRGAS